MAAIWKSIYGQLAGSISLRFCTYNTGILAADDIGDTYVNITEDINAFITIQTYPNTAESITYVDLGRTYYSL